MPPRNEINKKRTRVIASLSVLALMSTGAIYLLNAHASAVPTVPPADFCVLAPKAAFASSQERADVVATATVPAANPRDDELDTNTFSARQGDVIRVNVKSPRDGSIAVHGLIDTRPIAVDRGLTFEFKAIYSGRFPIHYHGLDGSHIEIAAVEILPKDRAPEQ